MREIASAKCYFPTATNPQCEYKTLKNFPFTGDEKYFAHKFVLAKSSDVFRTMLYERNWGEGAKEEVDLSETPECAAVFDKFLRFLYTAEVRYCGVPYPPCLSKTM